MKRMELEIGWRLAVTLAWCVFWIGIAVVAKK